MKWEEKERNFKGRRGDSKTFDERPKTETKERKQIGHNIKKRKKSSDISIGRCSNIHIFVVVMQEI